MAVRIMLVDDSPTERAYCTEILRPFGVEIVEFENGEDCLAKVKEVKPDLILLDVVMPGKNGYQTCRSLKRDPDTQNIPVVMLTSKSGDADKHWGMRQGADLYLVKPASEDDLIQAIKKYIAI
jgi:twitching motility two-component system response regulator PilH